MVGIHHSLFSKVCLNAVIFVYFQVSLLEELRVAPELEPTLYLRVQLSEFICLNHLSIGNLGRFGDEKADAEHERIERLVIEKPSSMRDYYHERCFKYRAYWSSTIARKNGKKLIDGKHIWASGTFCNNRCSFFPVLINLTLLSCFYINNKNLSEN